MSSQPDPSKSKSKSDRPQSKSKSKSDSSSTPQIPRSKFDDVLDNTSPEDLDPLERSLLEAYKNARTLTHQSVKSHHGLKHSSTVNPAWTEHYGDWDAEQFAIDNQNKRDRGDERRRRNKMGRARADSEDSDTSLESTVPSSRGTDTAYSDDFYDSGIGSEKEDDITSLMRWGHKTLTDQSSAPSSPSPIRRRNSSSRGSSRAESSRSRSRSPRSSHRPLRREDSRSAVYDSTSRPTSGSAQPPPTTEYSASSGDDYDPQWKSRPRLGGISGREAAHRRSCVAFDDDNPTIQSFRRSDPPTKVRSTSPSNRRSTANWDIPTSTNDSDDDDVFYETYDGTSHQSGWTLGTVAKVAATGAAAYGAYRVYQDPTLISGYVNTDTLHTAKDLASGVVTNVTTGVTDVASGVASGISSYAASAWGTLGSIGGALGSTVGGMKDTIASAATETMTNFGPAGAVAKGYMSSALGTMTDFGSSVGAVANKYPWLPGTAVTAGLNGAKLYMDYGRHPKAERMNDTTAKSTVKLVRYVD